MGSNELGLSKPTLQQAVLPSLQRLTNAKANEYVLRLHLPNAWSADFEETTNDFILELLSSLNGYKKTSELSWSPVILCHKASKEGKIDTFRLDSYVHFYALRERVWRWRARLMEDHHVIKNEPTAAADVTRARAVRKSMSRVWVRKLRGL